MSLCMKRKDDCVDRQITENVEEIPKKNQQIEDAVLKLSMQFFAEELLPYLGISGKVVSYAPTELVHLELKKLYMDFNLVMEDGSWKHFEFQSKNEGKNGLKRFHLYEVLAEYQHNVDVTTYVLFSGKIKNPMTEYTSGINTYHIRAIIMQHQNADLLLEDLQTKVRNGEVLTKQDLIPLTLCPLMGGEKPQKERFKAAFEITGNAVATDPQTVQKIEAVVYAMAEKFLDDFDMEEFKEGMKMTRLGQMLMNDGIAIGISQGISQGITQGIESMRKELIDIKLQKGKTVEQIADALELDVAEVQRLMEDTQGAVK